MKDLNESKLVQLGSELFDELVSSEELLLVKGGNVPPPKNDDCGCNGGDNGNCGCK